MKPLAEALRDSYEVDDKVQLVATLSAARDALESASGRDTDIVAVVDVLLDHLDQTADPEVLEWTLEALLGANFHPGFASLDLTRLVTFLRGARAEWLATGLEILSGTSDVAHDEFISYLTGHPDARVAATAADALEEIRGRRSA